MSRISTELELLSTSFRLDSRFVSCFFFVRFFIIDQMWKKVAIFPSRNFLINISFECIRFWRVCSLSFRLQHQAPMEWGRYRDPNESRHAAALCVELQGAEIKSYKCEIARGDAEWKLIKIAFCNKNCFTRTSWLTLDLLAGQHEFLINEKYKETRKCLSALKKELLVSKKNIISVVGEFTNKISAISETFSTTHGAFEFTTSVRFLQLWTVIKRNALRRCWHDLGI